MKKCINLIFLFLMNHDQLVSSESFELDRLLKITGNVTDFLVVAVGYKDVCSRRRCCLDNSFMRYEKLPMIQDIQERHCYHVPNTSKDGNQVVEIAIKTQGPFWEFYVPLVRLLQDECNVIDIKNERMIILKNSSGDEDIARCY